MPGLDTIRAIVEALRGGNWKGENEAAADVKNRRSTYNPFGGGTQDKPITGDDELINPIAEPHPTLSHVYGMSAGLRDKEYLDYVKSTDNPKTYQDWLGGGG